MLKKIIKNSKKLFSSVKNKFFEVASEDDGIRDIKPPEGSSEDKKIAVDISIWSATKIILIFLLLILIKDLIVEIKDILITFFLALFVAAALNPGVDKLEKKFKIPRWLGVIILYVVIISILSIIISSLIPIIIEQVSEMAIFLKNYLNKLLQDNAQGNIHGAFGNLIHLTLDQVDKQSLIEQLQKSLSTITDNLSNFATNALGIIISVANGIFNLIVIILLSFFMVVDREGLKNFFTDLFPKRYKKYITAKTHNIQIKIGEWVNGQIALFFIVGLISYIGFSLLGLKYALTLALVAGFAEFLPYIGPLITLAVATPLALNNSPIIFMWLLIFYAFLQFFEGNILVPMVMKKAVGLPPIVTIVALLIGWQFLGVIGMILSVPVASIAVIFLKDFIERKH